MMIRVSAIGLVVLAVPSLGQTGPLDYARAEATLDSGLLVAQRAGLAFSGEVESPGASWIRIYFGETILPEGARLVVTSASDGRYQVLTQDTLEAWSYSSAYFSGDRVYVDLYTPDNESVSLVSVDQYDAGFPSFDTRSICDGTDNRELSGDPRVARLAPDGCTAWLFNNRPNTLMTANHCYPREGDVVWFNVPLRTAAGSAVPPDPEDQYPVDGASVQASGEIWMGEDWATFGVRNNPETGLSPLDAQLASYVLATDMPPVDGRQLTVTGYGTTTLPMPASYSGVQKSHTGAYVSAEGSIIRYRMDTTGGNSGSAVFDHTANRVIGIHANGGCSSSSTSSNAGTSLMNEGLRQAIMTARGIAAGPVPAVISPLSGVPDIISPDGITEVSVELVADFTGPEPLPGVTLHVNDGSGWTTEPLLLDEQGNFSGYFPPTACGADVKYYFSAAGAQGEEITFPPSAPGVAFETLSSNPRVVIENSTLEASFDWAIETEEGAQGGWALGVPDQYDDYGGPITDADGTGSCWVTGIERRSDLDSGTTSLLSPVFDLADTADPTLSFAAWFNADASAEVLSISFSSDAGETWTESEALRTTAGWRTRTYRITDWVEPTGAFRFRISASDLGEDDMIEAGIDDIKILDISCQPAGCGRADMDAPFGTLDIYDISHFVGGFLAGSDEADLAAPYGWHDLNDIDSFVGAFVRGCDNAE